MRIINLVICALLCLQLSAQNGGLGFFDLSYGTIGEDYIDAASDGFDEPELKFLESGIGIGGSGKFFLNKFSAGGGGGAVFIKSDLDWVSFNTGFGYGTFGYNLASTDVSVVNASIRLGGFGNSINLGEQPEMTLVTQTFGDYSIVGETTLLSGSFLYGVEVDVLYFFPRIEYFVVGLSAYYMAPFTYPSWSVEGESISGIEEADFSHFGVSLKIGGGYLSF